MSYSVAGDCFILPPEGLVIENQNIRVTGDCAEPPKFMASPLVVVGGALLPRCVVLQSLVAYDSYVGARNISLAYLKLDDSTASLSSLQTDENIPRVRIRAESGSTVTLSETPGNSDPAVNTIVDAFSGSYVDSSRYNWGASSVLSIEDSSSFKCEACVGEIAQLTIGQNASALINLFDPAPSAPSLILNEVVLRPTANLHHGSKIEIGSVDKQEYPDIQTVINDPQSCSAEQDGSSVVITCADGTSGVLASEGTVVVYQSGEVGEPEIIEYPTGAVVVVDDEEVVLGEASGQDQNNKYIIFFDTPWPRVALKNKDGSLTVAHGPAGNATLFYLDENCTEGPFAESSESSIVLVDEAFYWKVPGATKTDLLVGSYKLSDSFFDNQTAGLTECVTYETARVRTNLVPAARYTMPETVINAKYPVRLKQLP